MKLYTFAFVLSAFPVLCTASEEQKGSSLSKALQLSEEVAIGRIFDLPSRDLIGSPKDLFMGERIQQIILIPDTTLKARAIVEPIFQEFINILRSEVKFAPLQNDKAGIPIGLILLSSGKVVLIRENENEVILQIGNKAGALRGGKFPNIRGIQVQILK